MKRITANTANAGEGLTLTVLVCDACLEGFPEEWRKLSEEEVPGHVCGVCGRDFEKEWRSLTEVEAKVFESVEAELEAPGPVGKDGSQLSQEEIEVLKRPTSPTEAEMNGLVPEGFDTETLRPEPVVRLGPEPSTTEIESWKPETATADLSTREHEHVCQKCCWLYGTKGSDEHVCPKCGFRQSCSLVGVETRLRQLPKLTFPTDREIDDMKAEFRKTAEKGERMLAGLVSKMADQDHSEMESRRAPGGAPVVWIFGLTIFWLIVFGIVWLVFH